MNIIAFDLGSTMAWADKLCAEHKTFEGTRVTRFAAIADFLNTTFNWRSYDVVIYETPLTRGQNASRILWGIAGILEAIVTQAERPILDVAVPTIKKFATGNGFASKIEMIKLAKQKFGYLGNDEHEADAVCLLHYGIANLEKLTA